MLLRKAMIFITLFCSIAAAQGEDSNLTSPRTQWYRDARVGMIVHWGLYSIPAGVWNGQQVPWYGEWIENRAPISPADYANLATQFNPTRFNAAQWIHYVKMAGMKYFCLVTKHHDGFCLWGTKQNSDWNVVDATPFKRDIVKELSTACKDSGITFAVYYSSGLDWHYPSSNWASYKQYYFAELKELLTNYGKIGYCWFDGEWTGEWNDQEAIDLENYVNSIDPTILTNNPKHKGQSTFGTFGIDEEYYTPTDPADWYKHGLWERDRLVQDTTWGYKSWAGWKKSVDLIRDMIDAASIRMNFCLNVGPMGDGSFPPQAVSILNDFGIWMKINGESIYKTGGLDTTVTMDCQGRVTNRDSTYYIQVFDWTAATIKITIPEPIAYATALDTSIHLGKATFARSGTKTTITIPKPAKIDSFATVIKLTPSAPVIVIAPGRKNTGRQSIVNPSLPVATASDIESFDVQGKRIASSPGSNIRDHAGIIIRRYRSGDGFTIRQDVRMGR